MTIKKSSAKSLLRFAGTWAGNDIDQCLTNVHKSRSEVKQEAKVTGFDESDDQIEWTKGKINKDGSIAPKKSYIRLRFALLSPKLDSIVKLKGVKNV